MPKKSLTISNLKFGATGVVENSDIVKYVYSGYGITFDSAGSWSFDSDTARNVMFGVDHSSSSHGGNHQNKFLILSEGPTFGIN